MISMLLANFLLGVSILGFLHGPAPGPRPPLVSPPSPRIPHYPPPPPLHLWPTPTIKGRPYAPPSSRASISYNRNSASRFPVSLSTFAVDARGMRRCYDGGSGNEGRPHASVPNCVGFVRAASLRWAFLATVFLRVFIILFFFLFSFLLEGPCCPCHKADQAIRVVCIYKITDKGVC
ncbi:hypothetical protein GGR53DRAFT_479903 [Hypoxylon sp. FL1150]|nr:hypothetical protein GGR53DRAFT_479903 [Hypoxylon sp. FL1150]